MAGFMWLPQAAVGSTLLSSTVTDTTYLRRLFVRRLADELISHNYEPGYARAVAERWVRLFGMTPINRREVEHDAALKAYLEAQP